MKWKTIKEKTTEFWLELKGDDGSRNIYGKKETPIYPYHAICKFDGCVDLRTYANGYSYDHECKDGCQCCEDYIHICDLDQFIKDLQDLSKKAKEFYKGKTGEDYWK